MMRGASRAFRSARLTWQRLLKDERGSVLAFFVAIPVVAGTVAVGVETGQLYRTKRQMQGAADAAALAGAIDKVNGGTNTSATAAALYEAQRNGFQNGVGAVTVTVHSPPTSGANVSTANAVEVIVAKPGSFALAKVLSSALGNSFSITSRSVAAQSSVTSSVYMASFNHATMKSVYTRGSFAATGYNSVNLTPPAQQNQSTAIVDPYASLPTPSPGTCSHNNYSQSSMSSLTVSPGTYCGGMSISSINNVYFTPGIYYVANGDLYITSVNNVTCPTCTTNNGVAIVLTQTTGNNSDIGGVRISSDNNISLNASAANQTSPPLYAGVVFYQDRRVPNGTMASTSKIFTISSLNTVTLTGAIYFPNNRIDIASINNASLSNNGCTVWIGRYIKFSSYNNNYVTGCAAIGVTPPGIITTTTTTSSTTASKGKVLE